MKVARIVVLLAVVALAAAVTEAGAQAGTPSSRQRGSQSGGQPGRPPSKWWQDEKTRALLGLTAEQTAKLEEVFQAAMGPQRRNLEELNRREKEFSALLLKNDTTEAEVMRQAAEVEVIRAEMSKARTLMLFRMNRILTPEQRVKLQEMHDGRDRGRPREPSIKKRPSTKD
jgi:Spy/CpxP family protein refolding chaperone